MTLHVARGLDLPDDFVTQPAAILARRGAGKTYTGSVLAEELLKVGLPVVMLDPLGVWFGLRSSADGVKPGLEVTILGGEHGDVPIDPTDGRIVAEMVVEEPGGWIIDMGLFDTKAAQDQFAYAFAERLYRAQRRESTPLHLMVDEAHNFVPQNMRGEGGIVPKMLGAFETLVRQGRSRGIGCTLISQRPAVVNKNVLSQVELLIAGQVTAKLDRDRLEEWAEGWATKAQIAEFAGSLASLKVGEAWFWSPQWLELFGRFTVRKRTTFDSSATPKVGEKRIEPRVLAPVDLETVKARFAATIEREQQSDPKFLQARIRELERALRTAQSAAPEAEVREVRVPYVPAQVSKFIDRVLHLQAAMNDHMVALATEVRAAAAILEREHKELPRPPADAPPRRRELAKETPRPPSQPGDSLGKAERAFLTVLVQHGACDRNRMALLAGYSIKSRHVDNTMGSLRTKGYVSAGWPAVATPAGEAALGAFDPLPTGAALRSYWLAHPRVTRAAKEFLEVLIHEYPAGMHRDDLAEAAGYSVTSRHVDNTLGQLRTLGLAVGGRDAIRASDDLMG